MKAVSANFGFLEIHDPQLVRLGALAERYFRDDPNTCLIKLRQFGELLAQLTAAKAGLYTSPEEPQADLLRRLKSDRILPREPADLFHQLRIFGNKATHEHAEDHRDALSGLKSHGSLGYGFTEPFLIRNLTRVRLYRLPTLSRLHKLIKLKSHACEKPSMKPGRRPRRRAWLRKRRRETA